jgi:aspartate/methionine/tyrosine aminotransferase
MASVPLNLAARGQVEAFRAMDVSREASAMEVLGRRILHLEVGQPGTRAPLLARDAVARALENDVMGYSNALGRDALRLRLARHYRDVYGLDLAPERFVITMGSSAGFILAFTALFNAGQGVAMATPTYPAYRNTLKALNLDVVTLRASAADNYQPTPGLIAEAKARAPNLAGVLIASPNNPTGSMIEKAQFASVIDACKAQGLWLISDEIYHGLTYGARAVSALELDDRAIVVNSFSKYFSMTGWRIGWMVVPEDLVRVFERLGQNLFISAPAISQVAALAALDAGVECEENRQLYGRNRAVLLDALGRSSFGPTASADGAFYLYVDTSPLSNDSEDLCRRLLHDAGLAATPGTDFDAERGRAAIRLSYAGPEADILEAAKILEAWR